MSAAVAAIQFALDADEGLTWLRLWNQGEFDKCRKEWPEAPEAVYIGADPMFAPDAAGPRIADWKTGDTFEYENDGGEMVWQSGIHTFGHWQSIVCYGKTEAEAVAKRDAILAAVGIEP